MRKKSLARDEQKKFSTVPSTKPFFGTSRVGAVHSTVAVASTLGRDIKDTGIRLAPVPLQIFRTLLRRARETSQQSPNDNKSAGKKSELHEEEDEITSAPTIPKDT